jgi:hypothetical protein
MIELKKYFGHSIDHSIGHAHGNGHAHGHAQVHVHGTVTGRSRRVIFCHLTSR